MRWVVAALLLTPASAWASHEFLPIMTVGFEDILAEYPQSDHDHNDLVLRYAARCDLDDHGRIVRQVIHVNGVAAGASKVNEVWIAPSEPMSSVSFGFEGDPLLQAPEPVTGHFQLVDDARTFFLGSPSGFVNTVEGAPVQPGRAAVIEFVFGTPSTGACPDVHFEIWRPGEGVGPIGLGTTVGANNQPLVGNFVGEWAPPAEQTPIWDAYGYFADWVQGLCTTQQCEEWETSPTAANVIERPLEDLNVTARVPSFATCNSGLPCGDALGICRPCSETPLASGVHFLASDASGLYSLYRIPPDSPISPVKVGTEGFAKQLGQAAYFDGRYFVGAGDQDKDIELYGISGDGHWERYEINPSRWNFQTHECTAADILDGTYGCWTEGEVKFLDQCTQQMIENSWGPWDGCFEAQVGDYYALQEYQIPDIGSRPQTLRAFGGYLYFGATDPDGQALFRLGADDVVERVAAPATGEVRIVTTFAGYLFLTIGPNLYAMDAAAGFIDLGPMSYPMFPVEFGGNFYVRGNTGAGWEVYRYTPSLARETVMPGANMQYLTAHGGYIYMFHPGFGYRQFKRYDGTTLSTVTALGTTPTDGSSGPVFSWQGKLYVNRAISTGGTMEHVTLGASDAVSVISGPLPIGPEDLDVTTASRIYFASGSPRKLYSIDTSGAIAQVAAASTLSLGVPGFVLVP